MCCGYTKVPPLKDDSGRKEKMLKSISIVLSSSKFCKKKVFLYASLRLAYADCVQALSQSELPRPIRESPWNQTTDVHRVSNLMMRVIT